jgi:HD-GYP domain-containing protein (c-di-GMP phosphodiesterase class II)
VSLRTSVASPLPFQTPIGSGAPAGRPGDLIGSEKNPSLRIAEVVSALSFALDLTTGRPMGHSVRACVLGMRIAGEINLAPDFQNDLYYALLLKDAGHSSNASTFFHALGPDDIKAKRDVNTTDWTRLSWETLEYALSHAGPGKSLPQRVHDLLCIALTQRRHQRQVTQIRSERGAALARQMGLSEGTAAAIASLDEHWNGSGNPRGLKRDQIPMLSRIMLLAQTLEVAWATSGPDTALDIAEERSGRWFDPGLVRAAWSLAARGALWNDLSSEHLHSSVVHLDTQEKGMVYGDTTLDSICLAFADIVDSKSPFTYQHSNGVANAAVTIARTLGLPAERVMFLRHAGLLHDLGKLSIPNTVLEKPGKLDPAEWELMRLHPFYTWKILSYISGFHELSQVSAAHHERLDGSGYFSGLGAEQLSLEMRILSVADVFDALSAKRPYRDALPRETVFQIMRKDTPRALDPRCVDALQQSGMECDHSFVDLRTLNERLRAAQRY